MFAVTSNRVRTYHSIEVKSSADRVPQLVLSGRGKAPFVRAHGDAASAGKKREISRCARRVFRVWNDFNHFGGSFLHIARASYADFYWRRKQLKTMHFPDGVRRQKPVFYWSTVAPAPLDGKPREEVRVLKVKRARLRQDGRRKKINNNTKTAVEQGHHHARTVSRLLSPCVPQRRCRHTWKKSLSKKNKNWWNYCHRFRQQTI